MDCKIGVRTYLEEELAKAKEKPKLRKVSKLEQFLKYLPYCTVAGGCGHMPPLLLAKSSYRAYVIRLGDRLIFSFRAYISDTTRESRPVQNGNYDGPNSTIGLPTYFTFFNIDSVVSYGKFY